MWFENINFHVKASIFNCIIYRNCINNIEFSKLDWINSMKKKRYPISNLVNLSKQITHSEVWNDTNDQIILTEFSYNVHLIVNDCHLKKAEDKSNDNVRRNRKSKQINIE